MELGEKLKSAGVPYNSVIRPVEGRVIVYAADPVQVSAALGIAGKSSGSASRHRDLEVDFVRADERNRGGPDAEGLLRGGAFLGGCTSGFVLRSLGSGAKRLSTAAHCGYTGDYLRYQNPNQAASTSLKMTWRHFGNEGDIAYLQPNSSFRPYPSFYAGVSEIRAVRSITSNFYEGRVLCRFGKTTHNECGRLSGDFTSRFAEYDSKDVGKIAHNLVEMKERKADRGDSGGPWYAPYQNSAAAGVHSGGASCRSTSGVCDHFTPISAFHQFGFEAWKL